MADFLRNLLVLSLLACPAISQAPAARFLRDDPIRAEPLPLDVGTPVKRDVDRLYNQLENLFRAPGTSKSPKPSGGVNTLGEVPDSAWYTNRHDRLSRMSSEDLMRGPTRDNDPVLPLTIVKAKVEGKTPGFLVEDSRGKKFVLKFDPPGYPGLTTASDVIGSRLFYALGYNVPENYITRFRRSDLAISATATVTNLLGRKRKMVAGDIDDVLAKINVDSDGAYRALASLFIKGDLLGPFLYHGTRSDDPNDLVPHEDRRDLRGLYVFAAWVNHYDAQALNTLDAVVQENGTRYIRHYLIDFGSMFGASSLGPRDARNGFLYEFAFRPAVVQLLTAGLYVPAWARAKYPDLPEAGRFESEVFDPRNWKPLYPNSAFENRLPGDTYWAARKLSAFTDDDIRALVATGRFSDPAAEQWIASTLIKRRDKLMQAFFSDVLPVDYFAIENGELRFEDLGARFTPNGSEGFTITWSDFDNDTGRLTKIDAALVPRVPESSGAFLAAEITGANSLKKVIVYLRRNAQSYRIVGVDRVPDAVPGSGSQNKNCRTTVVPCEGTAERKRQK